MLQDSLFGKKKIIEAMDKDTIGSLMQATENNKIFDVLGVLSKFKREKSEEIQKEIGDLTSLVLNCGIISIIF